MQGMPSSWTSGAATARLPVLLRRLLNRVNDDLLLLGLPAVHERTQLDRLVKHLARIKM